MICLLLSLTDVVVVVYQCDDVAAVVGGSVVGLLATILLIMFIIYRMRKADEGSYSLNEPKRSPNVHSYLKAPSREFFAWFLPIKIRIMLNFIFLFSVEILLFYKNDKFIKTQIKHNFPRKTKCQDFEIFVKVFTGCL